MAEVTVAQFAEVLKVPVEKLLLTVGSDREADEYEPGDDDHQVEGAKLMESLLHVKAVREVLALD